MVHKVDVGDTLREVLGLPLRSVSLEGPPFVLDVLGYLPEQVLPLRDELPLDAGPPDELLVPLELLQELHRVGVHVPGSTLFFQLEPMTFKMPDHISAFLYMASCLSLTHASYQCCGSGSGLFGSPGSGKIPDPDPLSPKRPLEF